MTIRLTGARVLARVLVFLVAVPPNLYAQQVGGQVIAGDVSIAHTGRTLTLDQRSQAAIVEWQQFGIAADELVRVLQPGPDAAMLARVVGPGASALLGHLQADGRFFLINPNGVIVGRDAVIDTGAFLASALDIRDADFLAGVDGGSLTFAGDRTAAVVNLGRITAREGDVLLVAHTVRNEGTIAAPNGRAGLAAGTEIVIAVPDAPWLTIRTNLGTPGAPTGVENTGVIEAAQAYLAAAGDSIYDVAINQTGVVRATGAARLPDGRVILTADGGAIAVDGSIAARDADGAGGEILIGGGYQGRDTTIANAASTAIASTARLDASAVLEGDRNGGRVIVWSDDETVFAGTISAQAGQEGGDGGFAEVSSGGTLTFAGTADLTAPAGATGALLLDPASLVIDAAGAATIATTLDTANVTSMADNDITVSAPIVNATTINTLTLDAPKIAVNADVTLPQGSVDFVSTMPAPATLTLDAAATISARQIGVRAGYTIVTLAGTLLAGDGLVYFPDSGAPHTFTAANAANEIPHLYLGNGALTLTGDVDIRSSVSMVVTDSLSTSGTLTLVSSGSLSFDHAQPSVLTVGGLTTLAATGGAFSTDGALTLSGAGRKRIYSATGVGLNATGLGYTQVNGILFPNDPLPGGNVIYIGDGALPMLTVTADNLSMVYGAPEPAYTASFSGGTAANLTAPVQFTVSGTPGNVGTYVITPFGAASTTHQLNYVSGTLTITPATLTYVALPASRTYGDGTQEFLGRVEGFVNGDTIATATTGTLRFTSTASATDGVGRYAIEGSGLQAVSGNYVFVQAPGNAEALSIEPAPLTVVLPALTWTYGDTAIPEAVGIVTGLVNGDDAASVVSVSNPYDEQTPVGTHTITPAVISPNYRLETVIGGTATVTPRPLTVRVVDTTMTQYGPLPMFQVALDGITDFDAPAATAYFSEFATTVTSTSPSGTYPVTVTHGNAATFANLSNYTLAVEPGTVTVFGSYSFVKQTIDTQPAELNTVTNTVTTTSTTATPDFIYSKDDIEDLVTKLDPPIEIINGTVEIWKYDEVMSDALDRLREAAKTDEGLRQEIEALGLLDLLESGDNATFLADIESNTTKQGLLMTFLDEVLMSYYDKPRETLPGYLHSLLDELEARTQAKKIEEAQRLTAKYDEWLAEQQAHARRTNQSTNLVTLFGTATTPDFLPEVRAEMYAAAITVGALAIILPTTIAAITGATAIAAYSAWTVGTAMSSMAILGSVGSVALAAGPAAIVVVAAITAAVRAIQVFEEAEVLAALEDARALVRSQSPPAFNLDNEGDRMNYTLALYDFINEGGRWTGAERFQDGR